MEIAEVKATIAETSTVLGRRVGMVVVMAVAEGKEVLLPVLLATSPINRSNPTLDKGGASAAPSLNTDARSARLALYLHLPKCRQGGMQPWLRYLETMVRFLA